MRWFIRVLANKLWATSAEKGSHGRGSRCTQPFTSPAEREQLAELRKKALLLWRNPLLHVLKQTQKTNMVMICGCRSRELQKNVHRSTLLFISAVFACCHHTQPCKNLLCSSGVWRSYPRGSGDVQVLHHFFKRGRLLRLFLIMQSDFFAKFARIIRGRHFSLFFSMECYAPLRTRAPWCRHYVRTTSLLTQGWRLSFCFIFYCIIPPPPNKIN